HRAMGASPRRVPSCCPVLPVLRNPRNRCRSYQAAPWRHAPFLVAPELAAALRALSLFGQAGTGEPAMTAIPTFDPPFAPSPGAQNKPEIKILQAEFGDGYSQPTPNGLNHIR